MRKVRQMPRVAVAAALAAVLGLALAAIALGDIVEADMGALQSDQVDGSTIVLNPGDQRTASFWIVESKDEPEGDRNGCNLNGSDGKGTLALDQGSFTKLAFGAPSGQFIACDDPDTPDTNEGTVVTATYTVNANACDGESGDVTVPVSYTATGGMAATGNNPASQFTLGTFMVQINCGIQPPPPAQCRHRAAPAIIAEHLHEHGLTPKQPTFRDAITFAAKKTGAKGEYGNDPCATIGGKSYEQHVLDDHHDEFPHS